MENQEEIRESLKAICTDATALEVARYVIQIMDREADNETLEFDFHMTQGVMHSGNKNVWFKFDTKPHTILHDVKKAMFEADCNVAELEFIDGFNRKVCDAILVRHADDVHRILTRVMFRGKAMPMRLAQVVNFEVIDFSQVPDSENYQLVIEKAVPQDKVDSYSGVGISEELFRINRETGKGFNAIIREKKAAGDPNYEYVVAATTNKMLWECQVDFYVDFSLPPRPEAPSDELMA